MTSTRSNITTGGALSLLLMLAAAPALEAACEAARERMREVSEPVITQYLGIRPSVIALRDELVIRVPPETVLKRKESADQFYHGPVMWWTFYDIADDLDVLASGLET